MSDHRLLIVHPGSDGASYQELARRLFAARKEKAQEVTLCSSRELCDMAVDRASGATLAVVDPVGCAVASGDRSGFFSRLALARKRIMVLAEAVEDARYLQQFRLPVDFDAVFDVGFISQKDKHPFPKVPYHFVFNGLTEREERVVAELSPSRERHIPWALVGHQTPENLDLVMDLMHYERYSGGFVFLEPPRRAGRRGRPLGSSGLAAVLSKTSFYVWAADHSSAYYESARFVQALPAGTVPCKIDGGHAWEGSGIPNVFPSVRSFCEKVQEEDFWSMYRPAREFCVSRGPLAGHLEEALRLV